MLLDTEIFLGWTTRKSLNRGFRAFAPNSPKFHKVKNQAKSGEAIDSPEKWFAEHQKRESPIFETRVQ